MESINSNLWSQSPTTSLPSWLRDLTSLDSYYFIDYMNRIGWPQGGTFPTLLSTAGYDFHERNGLMVPKAEEDKVKDALVLLILELYVPFTIAIISSESTIKNTDCPSIF